MEGEIMNNAIDDKLKQYASRQRMQIPREYDKRVNEAIKKSTDVSHEPIKLNLYKRAAAAAITLCILIAGSMGTYAAVNYVQKRMDNVPHEEKQKLAKDVQKSDASADSFSREFSDSEKKRLEELAKDYEGKGIPPEGSLLEISKTSEIDKNRVCFLAKTSMFYLPKRELTEEEMLEIIDFNFKRDYALISQPKDEKIDMSGVKEITEKEAITKALTAFKEVLSIDVKNMEIQGDYEQQYDETTASSTNYVSFINPKTGETYIATVNLQTGKVEGLECDFADSESSYVYTENADIDDAYEKSSDAAKKMFDGKKTLESAKAIYYKDQSNGAYRGRLTFYYLYQDEDVCIVKYDIDKNAICSVTCVSKEAYLAHEDDMKRSAERLGLEIIKKEL